MRGGLLSLRHQSRQELLSVRQLLNVLRESGKVVFELSDRRLRRGPAELTLKVTDAATGTKPANPEGDGKRAGD